ncbi:MAG: hypothetical protein C0596_10725 [Marinilabiliales bacterium]|nr:MAG: hypothetical protein C0596_10725 [Marinilabiliales bacterium]
MSFLKLNKGFFIAIIGLVLINILLEYYYLNFICPKYFYAGFVLDFSFVKYFESKAWFTGLLFVSLIINKKSSFIGALYLFLLLMIFVPGHIIYSYSNGMRQVFY